jgi:polysaccharide biosynthesis protein VpsM
MCGLALLGSSGPAAALDAEDVLYFRWGPLTLKPQVGFSEMYNDNIFYTGDQSISDLISVISPGLKLQLGRPEQNFVSLSYTLDQLFYLDNSELNTQQHTIEIQNRLEGQRINLVGSDRIQVLSQPLSGVVERIVGPGGVVSITGRNIDRLSFDDVYTVSYALGEKTAVYLRGNHYSMDYDKGIGIYDIRTLTGTAGFAYRAFTKTFLFGEVYYGQTATEPNDPGVPENPDLRFVGGYVGARGNFTQKLSGSVKVGYESREFADGTGAPSDPVVDLSLTQRFSEKQALTLSYSRQNNVSVSYSRQTYSADTFGAQFSQLLGSSRKWRATVGGSYNRYSYETVGGFNYSTEYDYWRAFGNVSYQIQRWMTAMIGYDHEQVAGDQRGVIDYDVNRVTLRLNFGF